MRTILKNARAQASTAVDLDGERHVSRLENLKHFAIASVAIVVLGVITSTVARYHRSQPQSNRMQQQTRTVPTVTIINATGEDGSTAKQPPSRITNLTKLAIRGDIHAQSKLAIAYLRGDGVDVDPVAAISWSEMAAVQGEPNAQFILATLYAKGIKSDPRLADRWLASAASRGNLKAMHNLAIAYLNGDGVSKDPAAAVNWLRKAALAGYRDSAFDLAVLYERGEGVHQDPSLAMQWYNLAASQGDLEAAKRLDYLKTSLATSYRGGRSP
jgi:localization factor PodJL